MKTIKALFVIAFAIVITSSTKAQNYNEKLDGPFAITKVIKVNGVCDMCKHRIEGATHNLPGLWLSVWDVDSKTLLIKYDGLKIKPDKIQQLITATGHDTEKLRAPDAVYAKLPDCCHYQRKS